MPISTIQPKTVSYFLSCPNHTQIDFILIRTAQMKNIKDAKMISSEECITHNKLLVCDSVVSAKPVKAICIPPRLKTLKLKDTVVQKEFGQAVSMKHQQIPAEVDHAWESIKNRLLEAADEICGWAQGGCTWHKETWWWNNDADNAVKEKQKAWK